MRQYIYKYNPIYTINSADIGVTFFEIPKNSSSTVKRMLFATLSGEADINSVPIGGGSWPAAFPECYMGEYDAERLQSQRLAIARDPVKRLKSAYRNNWIKRAQNTETLSEFVETALPTLISRPPKDTFANHFKPQHWFLPESLLAKGQLTLWPIERVGELHRVLTELTGVTMRAPPEAFNRSRGDEGVVDMTDQEIADALPSAFAPDYTLHKKALAGPVQ